MSVLSEIRALPEAIRSLSSAASRIAIGVDNLIELQRETGNANDRLQELEVSRARWEAEIEASMLRADSTLKSAANAEARSRTMVRHAEKLVDPFSEEGDEVPETAPGGDDPRGEAEELLQVPVGMAPNNKAHALRAKWMV